MSSLSGDSKTDYGKGVLVDGLPKAGGKNKRPPEGAPGSATDQALMSAERLLGVKIIRQMNEEGRITFIICTDNGQKIDFDENGNIFIVASKIGDDEDGGNMTLRSFGDLTLKIGGKLNLEIENMIKEDKPVSIKVGGDCNIEATDGDLALKGKNVIIRADNDLSLFGGSKVQVTAGEENGGALGIGCSAYTLDAASVESKVSGQYKIEQKTGHYILEQKDKRCLVDIDTKGSYKLNTGGDYKWNTDGKFAWTIGGGITKPVPIVTGADSYSLSVTKGNTKFESTKGNHTETFTDGNYTRTMSDGNYEDTVTGQYKSTITKNFIREITKDVKLDYKDIVETNTGRETKTISQNSSIDVGALVDWKASQNINLTSSSGNVIVSAASGKIFLN